MLAHLVSSRELAPEVRHLVFEAVDTDGLDFRLDFTPGQFVSFTGTVGGKEITRAYSLASAPNGTNRFELCLNLVTGGHLTPHLFAMQPGDSIAMRQPLGTFVLRNPAREGLYVATGTGIAPFRAILQAHLRPESPAVTLLFGVRHESHILYRSEFASMAARFSRFQFYPTLTRPDAAWAGRTGRVQVHLVEAIGARRDLDFYLCGRKEMVDEVRAILKSMGFDRKQIAYEKYD